MRLNINTTAFTAFCTCNLQKCQETVLTKLTKLFILEALSPQQLPMLSLPRPVRLAGFFLGATSAIFSMMISALGFSGSSPQ